MYYKDYRREPKTITSIKITSDLKKKVDLYKEVNPNWDLSNFVIDELTRFFSDPDVIKNDISFLKNQLKIAKNMLKNSENLHKNHKKISSLDSEKIKKFLKEIGAKEIQWLKTSAKRYKDDPTYIKGMLNYYYNIFGKKISQDELVNLFKIVDRT